MLDGLVLGCLSVCHSDRVFTSPLNSFAQRQPAQIVQSLLNTPECSFNSCLSCPCLPVCTTSLQERERERERARKSTWLLLGGSANQDVVTHFHSSRRQASHTRTGFVWTLHSQTSGCVRSHEYGNRRPPDWTPAWLLDGIPPVYLLVVSSWGSWSWCRPCHDKRTPNLDQNCSYIVSNFCVFQMWYILLSSKLQCSCRA